MKATNHDYKTIHAEELSKACQHVLEDDPDLCAYIVRLKQDRPDGFMSRNRRRRIHEPERN